MAIDGRKQRLEGIGHHHAEHHGGKHLHHQGQHLPVQPLYASARARLGHGEIAAGDVEQAHPQRPAVLHDVQGIEHIGAHPDHHLVFQLIGQQMGR